MLKNSFFVVIALLVFASVRADEAYLAPLVKESLLLDINSANQTVIVGERGHILVSDNQVNDFEQVKVPTTATLTAVFGIQDQYWAVGHDASILKSTQGADKWSIKFSDKSLERPFLDVMFLDQNHGIAVGGYGMFYRTLDGGETWTPELHASVLTADDLDYLDSIKDDLEFYNEELSYIIPNFNRINQAGDLLLLAGEGGLLAVSQDLGKSWERYDIDYQGSLFDVKAIQENLFIAVGLRGKMFVKRNDEDWTSIETCLTTSLNSIVFDEDSVFAVGNNGVVLNIDSEQLFSDELHPANNDNCSAHKALTLVETDISSSISNAAILNDQLLAITANGIQSVSLAK
ncbi:WD40/YVTN/BNR-like repeat-containing protein [Glaciecola sp. 1036]|uniref:WD40/YVTN/BNR-like repeat-containing protein n=1 Tax=Alteromonadaceae TaxID=72275 RepID=UPI003D00F639